MSCSSVHCLTTPLYTTLCSVLQTLIPRFTGAIVDAIVDKKTPQEFQVMWCHEAVCPVQSIINSTAFTTLSGHSHKGVYQAAR